MNILHINNYTVHRYSVGYIIASNYEKIIIQTLNRMNT